MFGSVCAVIFGFKKSRADVDPPTSIQFVYPVDIDRPVAEVWTFLRDPEFTSRYRDDVVSAVTMPGTGEGVGEVQAFVYQQLGTYSGMFIEVVEFEPGRRAVHRNLDEKLPVQLREALTETLVEPVNAGQCRLTHTVTVNAAAGYVLTPELVNQLEAGYGAFWEPTNHRIRTVLEGDDFDT